MARVNPYLNFHGNTEEAQRIFNKLSEGGNVGLPMTKTFLGGYLGLCDDKFGTSWMIDYSTAQVEADAEKTELEKIFFVKSLLSPYK